MTSRVFQSGFYAPMESWSLDILLMAVLGAGTAVGHLLIILVVPLVAAKVGTMPIEETMPGEDATRCCPRTSTDMPIPAQRDRQGKATG